MDFQTIIHNITIIDITMIFIYLFGVLVLAKQYLNLNRKYFFLFFFIGLVHLFFTLAYYFYSLGHSADSIGYIRKTLMHDQWLDILGQGGDFIKFILYPLLKLGLSYLGCMVIFSFIGLLSYNYLLKIAIHINNYSWSNWYYLLLLPNLHFWTNAVGKDSLIFYGICGLIFCIYFKKKLIYYIIPILLIGFIRMHILAFILFAYILSKLVMQKSMKISSRILVVIISAVIFFLFLPLLKERVGLGEDSDISDRIEHMQNVNQIGGSSVNMSDSNFLIKWISYLFRPFFFEAHNFFALLASFENIVWVIMIGYIIFSLKKMWFYMKGNTFFWFCLTAIITVSVPSAYILTNFGIAVRQKMMFFPFIFVCIFLLFRSKNIFSKISQRR
jgi:hypothetical protein